MKPVLFYCSGSGHLKWHQLPDIRTVQQKIVRRWSIFPERLIGPMIYLFFSQTASKIKFWISSQLFFWEDSALVNYFSWAGWVARLDQFDPDRITLDVSSFKNISWILNVASVCKDNQGHNRRFRVWRWEDLVFKGFGPAWAVHARDSESCKVECLKVVQERSFHPVF